MSNGFLSHNCV
ncbi:MAG TPA: hypothetical protein DDW65_22020 [Firmicutes bacterium]|nr:hypothetical protein [Bacillota bacterium]